MNESNLDQPTSLSFSIRLVDHPDGHVVELLDSSEPNTIQQLEIIKSTSAAVILVIFNRYVSRINQKHFKLAARSFNLNNMFAIFTPIQHEFVGNL